MPGRRSCKSNLGTCVLLRSRDPYRLAAERPTFPARIAFWDNATSVPEAATRAGMNGSRGNWRSVELLRRPTSLHLAFTPSSRVTGLRLLIARRSARQFRAPNSFNELDRAFFNGKINVRYDSTLEKESSTLIGQSDFHRGGRSKDRRNDLACGHLTIRTHSHHGDEVCLERKVRHLSYFAARMSTA